MTRLKQLDIFLLGNLLIIFLSAITAYAQPENVSLLREANISITNAANANPYQYKTLFA
jgi:hypothetical protein